MKIVQVKNLRLGEGMPAIAVPVMADSREEILRRVRLIAASEADLLELRADAFGCLEDTAILGTLLREVQEASRHLPVLFTVRTKAEGGLYGGAHYAELLSGALAEGQMDLLDVELAREGSSEILREAGKQGVPVVASWHNFHGTPGTGELRERLREMEAAGASVVKLACMPEDDAAADRLLAAGGWAARHLSVPSVVIAMGERGRASRIAGEAYGSVISFGCLPGEASAPGQMEIPKLRAALQALHELKGRGDFLFLTGFMGSGKSTVASYAARRTGLPVIEMDAEIERKAGRTITRIFAEEGEEAFRDLETHLLAGLFQEERAIVSCGGGCVLRPENRALMHALGRVVYLTAEPDVILQRLRGEAEQRPNIRDRMTLEGVRELMDRRAPAYEAAADLRVATDGKTPGEIFSELGLACPVDLL